MHIALNQYFSEHNRFKPFVNKQKSYQQCGKKWGKVVILFLYLHI